VSGMAMLCIIGIRVMSYVSIYELDKIFLAIPNIVFKLDVSLYSLWIVCVFMDLLSGRVGDNDCNFLRFLFNFEFQNFKF